MSEIEIVIARYNEDISWSYRYKEYCVVYNKGRDIIEYPFKEVINLENVGRESHTYLYHIITHWDKLAIKTLFTQGNIFDHVGLNFDLSIFFVEEYDFIIKNGALIKDYDSTTGEILHYGKWEKELEEGKMMKAKKSFVDWCKEVLNISLDNGPIFYGPGATFSVSKRLIYNRPLEFYKYLMSFLENHPNPEEGHYLERTWVYIFCDFNAKILVV
jgi:hypothetical protein